jgi:hypothetical protein
MNRLDAIFTAGVALIFASALFVAKVYKEGWVIEANLFPVVITVPALILAAILLVKVLRGKPGKGEKVEVVEGAPAGEGGAITASEARRRTYITIAWILGFFFAIWLIGFTWWTITLFLVLYLKLQAGEGWKLTGILTLVCLVFFIYLFVWTLHLPFPEGQVLLWLGLPEAVYLPRPFW